jgi:hypothetical protein
MELIDTEKNDTPTYALSVKQPWALLIVAGYKNVENRSWPTKFRGRIYIHASTSKGDMGPEIADWILRRLDKDKADAFSGMMRRPVFGAIIGEVDIVDCVQNHPSKWSIAGQYQWVLDRPAYYVQPIPCRGALGLFKPSVEIKACGNKTPLPQVRRKYV